jgi:hypothetical protein
MDHNGTAGLRSRAFHVAMWPRLHSPNYVSSRRKSVGYRQRVVLVRFEGNLLSKHDISRY